MKRITRLVLLGMVAMLAATAAAAQGPPFPYSVSNNWTLSVTTGNTGQNMYRAPYTTSCGAYALLPAGANIPPLATTFTDSTVVPGASYCYGITAIGANGKESALTSASTNPELIPPAPPTGFNSTVALLNGQEDVTVAWKQPTNTSLTANDIYAGLKPGGPYNLLHLHMKPTDQLVYKGAPKGNYKAVVTATGLTGQSGPSNEITIVVP